MSPVRACQVSLQSNLMISTDLQMLVYTVSLTMARHAQLNADAAVNVVMSQLSSVSWSCRVPTLWLSPLAAAVDLCSTACHAAGVQACHV